MSGRLVAYRFIVFQFLIFFFVGTGINLPGINNSFRLKFFLSLVVTIVFLPLVILALKRVINNKSKLFGLAVLIRFCYPPLIALFVLLGGRPLPEGLHLGNIFTSGIPWILNGICFLVVFTFWSTEEHLKFHKLLWKGAILLSLESVVFFYLLRDTSLAKWSVVEGWRFVSVLNLGGEIIGVYGLILMALSIMSISQGVGRRKYKFSLLLGLLLTVSSLQRSVLGGLIIFSGIVVFLLFIRGIRRTPPAQKVVQGTVVSMLLITLLSLAGGVFVLYRESVSNPASAFARLLFWSQGVDLIATYFPIGVGGGLSGAYVTSRTVKQPVVESALLELAEGYEYYHFGETEELISIVAQGQASQGGRKKPPQYTARNYFRLWSFGSYGCNWTCICPP